MESANNDFNAATYIFMMASKIPKNWKDKFSTYNRIDKAVNWIGIESKNALTKFLYCNAVVSVIALQ